MTKNIKELLKIIEKQVVGILLANKYVTLKDSTKGYKYSNIIITADGKKAINSTSPVLTIAQINQYRQLFPVGKRGPGATPVGENLSKFMEDNDASFEEVLLMTKKYIDETPDPTYLRTALYFLYKRENNILISTAEEWLELIRTKNYLEQEDDFRTRSL